MNPRDRADSWLETAESTLVVTVLFVTPFLFGGVTAMAVFFFQTLTAAAALVRIARVATGGTGWFGRAGADSIPQVLLFCAVLPFIAYAWIQTFAPSGPGLPGSQARFMTYDYAIQLGMLAVFFVLCCGFLESRRRARIVFFGYALVAAALIVTGFYHQGSELEKKTALWDTFDMTTTMAYYSFFLNPNHYGGFLAILTPFWIASIVRYAKRVRLTGPASGPGVLEHLLYATLLPATTLSILDAEARSAFLLQCGWVFLAILVWADSRSHVRAGILLAAVAAFAAALPFISPHFTYEKLLGDLDDRFAIFRDAFKIARDFPVFGVGLGASRFFIPYYQTVGPEQNEFLHLYNHHIELMADGGFTGYALLVLPLGAAALHAAFRVLRSTSEWTRIFGAAAFLVLIAYAAVSLVDDYLITPALAIFFTFNLSLLARCASGAFVKDRRDEPEPAHEGRVLLRAACAVAAAAAVALLWTGARHGYDIQRAMASGDPKVFDAAKAKAPEHAYLYLTSGHYHFDEALRLSETDPEASLLEARRAVADYEAVTRLVPSWAEGWSTLGRAEILAGERREGIRHLGVASTLNPTNRDRMLYVIHTSLRLSGLSPWEDERKYFRAVAMHWLNQAVTQAVPPLSEMDNEYRNLSARFATPEDIRALLGLFKQYRDMKRR